MQIYYPLTPPGYFNATELLPKDDKNKRVLKPTHFMNNLRISRLFEILHKYPKVIRGRGACTFLPIELKPIFESWIILNIDNDKYIKEQLMKNI